MITILCSKQNSFGHKPDVLKSHKSESKQETNEDDMVGLVDKKIISIAQFICNFCGKFVVERNRLNGHKKIHNVASFQCDICANTFYRKKELNIHQQSIHESVKYECRGCYRSFGHKSNLDRHFKKIHSFTKKNKLYFALVFSSTNIVLTFLYEGLFLREGSCG